MQGDESQAKQTDEVVNKLEHTKWLSDLGSLSSIASFIVPTAVFVYVFHDDPTQAEAFWYFLILACVCGSLAISMFLRDRHVRTVVRESVDAILDKSKIEIEAEKLSKALNKAKKEILTQDNHQKKSALIVHNINHEVRNNIVTYIAMLGRLRAGGSINVSEISQMRSIFSEFMIYFCANVQKLADMHTRGECSVCIKILFNKEDHDHLPAEESIFVRTFFRDPISYRKRKSTDRSLPFYKYRTNTAFTDILENKSSYFCIDNLRNYSKNVENDYQNGNRFWYDYYNACLVAPIRLKVPVKRQKGGGEDRDAHETQENVKIPNEYRAPEFHEKPQEKLFFSELGFICIDNFEGGFIDNEALIELINGFGDLLYVFWYQYDRMAEAIETAKAENRIIADWLESEEKC